MGLSGRKVTHTDVLGRVVILLRLPLAHGTPLTQAFV